MTRKHFLSWCWPGLLLVLALSMPLSAGEQLTLASTTSTLDSGLFDALVPVFEKKCDCRVKVIAVGTGQAIRLARDGNADVLLVHDRDAEEKFVADGFGLERLDVMHNDFIMVGPKDDPAGIKGATAAGGLKRILLTKAFFVSRGDDSGTHKKELKLWASLAIHPDWDNYLESGSGMEATLRIANEKLAYCLVDRATWLAHQKEIDGLSLLLEGDPLLFNPYSVIAVSPVKYPHVKAGLAHAFIEFIRGPEGQAIIRGFGKEKYGQPLFFPDVVK